MKSLFKELIDKSKNGVYIIAEIGVNHEGSIAKAKSMIESAARAGASAAKFQSYKAETLADEKSPAYWDTSKELTKSQYELFKKYDQFNEQQYKELAEYCEEKGIDFLSTPFDTNSVEYLDPIVKFFKVASADITNYKLLRQIAKKNKPILLSTGASTIDEIDCALKIISEVNNVEVGLMHCVLNYPTDLNEANLKAISQLKEKYKDNIIGYSDHTVPEENDIVILTSINLGAKIIEKHYTYDRYLEGNDHYHAMDEFILMRLNEKIGLNKKIIGNKNLLIDGDREKEARLYARRGLYFARDMNAGEEIKDEDIIPKRPINGIPANQIDDVVGRKLNVSVKSGVSVTWDQIK